MDDPLTGEKITYSLPDGAEPSCKNACMVVSPPVNGAPVGLVNSTMEREIQFPPLGSNSYSRSPVSNPPNSDAVE